MYQCLKPHLLHVKCVLLADVCGEDVLRNQVDGEDNFSIQTYNRILKSVQFWKYLNSFTERVLLIQDDAMIVKPGLEDDVDMTRFDYIGAPWKHVDMLRAHGVAAAVGNGGLSIRRTQAMLDIVTHHDAEKLELFGYNNMIIPEDVYFAKHIHPDAQCTLSVAEKFAFEMTTPSQPTFGFHKPWVYLDLHFIKQYFKAVISH
jgi:hypothetical protein